MHAFQLNELGPLYIQVHHIKSLTTPRLPRSHTKKKKQTCLGNVRHRNNACKKRGCYFIHVHSSYYYDPTQHTCTIIYTSFKVNWLLFGQMHMSPRTKVIVSKKRETVHVHWPTGLGKKNYMGRCRIEPPCETSSAYST